MQRSLYLAKLIGPVLIAIALGILLNNTVYRAMANAFLANYALIYISGVITMVAGIALILAHNVWKGWPAIITVIGWLGIIGGAVRIVVPQQVERIGGDIMAGGVAMVVAGFVILVAGAVLCWFGFELDKASSGGPSRRRRRR